MKSRQQKYEEAADRNLRNSLAKYVKEAQRYPKFTAEDIAHVLGVRLDDTVRMKRIKDALKG